MRQRGTVQASPRRGEAQVRRRPLLLRPAYFAFDAYKAFVLFWVHLSIRAFATFLGVVGFVTGTEPRDLMTLQFGSPKGKKKNSSFTDRLKEAASMALPSSSSEVEALKGELLATKTLVAKLESEAVDRKMEQTAMATTLMVNEIAHEIQPDLRDEFEVEQKLLVLLENRMKDTREAEEYKKSAETQAVYFNGIIESLRGDLLKELHVIESQQEDKASLEKKINIARNLIENLKEKLAEEEERREKELEEQKKKYKSQTERISSEFKTATDFCKDLRRKLEAETKHKELLLKKNEQVSSELASYKSTLEELTEKNKEMAVALQEERNQLSLAKKEREMESRKFQESSQHLKETLTRETNRVVFVQNKSAEEKAKLLEENNQKLKETTEKYERELKEAHKQYEEEKKRHEAEHKIATEVIESLKVKDTDDVRKEQLKWTAELQKQKQNSEHEVALLNRKLKRMEDEVAAALLLNQTMKAQYEQEKKSVEQLESKLSTVERSLETLTNEKQRLSQELNQIQRELDLERNSLNDKLVLEKKTAEKHFNTELKAVEKNYREELQKVERELSQKSNLLDQTEKRLEQTKKELISRLSHAEHDKKDAVSKMHDAEKLVKSKEQALQDTSRLQEAASQRASALAASLQDEQRNNKILQSRLEEEIKARQEAAEKQSDYVKTLENEVSISKKLIDTLKPQYFEERDKNKKLLEEWRADKVAMEARVAQLQATLQAERENLSKEHQAVTQLEIQSRSLSDRNEALKKDLNATTKNETTIEKVTHEEVNTIQSV